MNNSNTRIIIPIRRRTTSTSIKKTNSERLWGLRGLKVLMGMALPLAVGYFYKK
jgi:hypothetical protein